MDTSLWLKQTQTIFHQQSREFSWERFLYNLLTPPWWMVKGGDRRFCSLYRDRHLLLTHGQIVWGRIVQANAQLYQPGKEDRPASIVYSPDPLFNGNVGELVRIARELYELKNKTIEHPEMLNLKVFAAAITDEVEALFNVEIPNSIAANHLVYYTTTMIHRKHIPLGYLKAGWFPLVVAPQQTPATMILPCRYWCSTLLQMWCNS